eukprot:m.193716 g.193716  ORF g.193716 m.193716 type:complete len:329 (-) comp32516_c0_seq2:477-1463(-)
MISKVFAVCSALALANLASAVPEVRLETGQDRQCSHAYPAGRHKVEISGGRYFLLLVPERLQLKPAPIVIDVPGFSESPYYQVELNGIEEYLENLGWIAAVPFGTAPTHTTTCCPADASGEECESGVTLDKQNSCSFNAGGCCGVASSRRAPDVDLAKEIVEFLGKNMCGDESKVFATGFSNGGMMTNRLGCDASELFTGIAPVAGNVRLGGDFTACRPSSPVAYFGFCGDVDTACNKDFDKQSKDWAERNKCDLTSDPTPSFTTETTKCFRWEQCEAHTEYCSFIGLAHEWPGRERPDGTSKPQPSTNIDATAFIFDRWSNMVTSSK